MGQHKTNPNVLAVKRGELKPKPKAVKPPTEKEASFLARWAAVIMAGRPEPKPRKNQIERSVNRQMRRVTAAQLRQTNRLALAVIRERQKAARKAA